MRVLIAGAGIAGLTTALSLHAAGIEAQLVDSASELKPLGVGINLLPHAVRELTELGLGAQLAAAGIATSEQAHFDRHGSLIWSEPRGRSLGYAWPQYSIHRGELQMILLAAVRDRLGERAVKTSTTVTGFTERGGSVEVMLSSRRNARVVPVTADVLIGADGLYSAVRAQLHPDEPPPRWSGVMLWRGAAEGAPFLSGSSLAIVGSTTTVKFVAYPIAARPSADQHSGRALINWVAEVMIGGAEPPIRPDWNREGRLAEALPYFQGWTFDWLDVPGLMTRTREILQYPMVDRDPLPGWGRGRVTLAGDAAHPMYPIGSNGGSQAIIDARVLARALATAATPADGLAAYEAERLTAVNQIVLANRNMPVDQVLDLVSARAPDGFDRVEDVLAPDELAALRDAYRATSLQDVAALNARPPGMHVPPATGSVAAMDEKSRGSVRVEQGAKRVRAYLAGRLVADTKRPFLVWEIPYYPAYYLPLADVAAALEPTGKTEHSPSRGEAEILDVRVEGAAAAGAAKRYRDSPLTALRDLVRIDWGAMDEWLEEDEPVYTHPRDPYKRVDILASSRHVRVEIDGVAVADSVRPHILYETGLPPRYYLPLPDVRTELLIPSDTTSHCPYKGTAGYWSVDTGRGVHPDLVWIYRTPLPESQKVAGLACFYNEKVDLYVDGELQPRPRSPFS